MDAGLRRKLESETRESSASSVSSKMVAVISLPSKMVAVILGASEWPKSPGLPGSPSFRNSAAEFKKYLLDPNGLNIRSENVLDLFDDQRAVGELDDIIGTFFAKAAIRFGHQIRNLIL